MQKACGHSLAAAPTARGHAVSGLFHSPPGVLFTFPSRYWFAIGHRLVFSLGGWAPRIRTGFHVSRPTWDAAGAAGGFGYGALTRCGRPFQAVPLPSSDPVSRSRNPRGQAPWFGLLRVRSPLLAKSLLFSFPPGTEMFHFPGCRAGGLWIDPSSTRIAAGGFPHSEIHGSKRVGRSPWLIAASRVLRRLAMPRHPPHARQRLSGNRLCTRMVRTPARRSLRHSSGRFGCQRSKEIGHSGSHCGADGGGNRARTGDIQLAKLALYQLSYTPGEPESPGSRNPGEPGCLLWRGGGTVRRRGAAEANGGARGALGPAGVLSDAPAPYPSRFCVQGRAAGARS